MPWVNVALQVCGHSMNESPASAACLANSDLQQPTVIWPSSLGCVFSVLKLLLVHCKPAVANKGLPLDLPWGLGAIVADHSQSVAPGFHIFWVPVCGIVGAVNCADRWL